jgi:hypothetical protein
MGQRAVEAAGLGGEQYAEEDQGYDQHAEGDGWGGAVGHCRGWEVKVTRQLEKRVRR